MTRPHEDLLASLATAEGFLYGHPTVPSPSTVVVRHDSPWPLTLAWHTNDDHDAALTVLRAFTDGTWHANHGSSGVTCYEQHVAEVRLEVYANNTPAPVTAPINLLDALAEVTA